METDAKEEQPVNSEFEVRASLNLGQLSPEDVSVELYGGELDADREIVEGHATRMAYVGVRRGVSLFAGKVHFQQSGLRGYTLRVLPRHEDLANPFDPRLILWGA
jgi:starch phosphorylase